MENLPEEVLSNILFRLLAKQLVQMRCTSKYWNALLSKPEFVKSHLHHSIHNKNEILLFFKKGGTFDFDSNPGPSAARATCSPDIELKNLIKLKLPVDPQHKKSFGLCCWVGERLNLFFYRSYQDFVIRIWNPFLSALLTLPTSSLSHNATHFGFGFDPKNNDYKVVRLPSFFQEPDMVSQPQGEVYSMRKGCWESISQRIPSHIKMFIGPYEVCVDGRLHWICVIELEQKPNTIVTFDLGEMKYGEIRLPDISIDCRKSLGVLCVKLCVMSINGGCKCDVWVMDDESWVKHHVFSPLKCYINPYGFTSRRNEFLFQAGDGPRFALYDPIAANTQTFKIKCTGGNLIYKSIWIHFTTQRVSFSSW